MKKLLIISMFLPFILWRPTPTSFGQMRNKSQKTLLVEHVDRKINGAFDTLFANLDTLTKLSAQRKTIVIKKIEYVKVYKTIPVYVPQVESDSFKKENPTDTLENDYYIVTPPKSIKPEFQKKKSLLYKIFHPFKKHNI